MTYIYVRYAFQDECFLNVDWKHAVGKHFVYDTSGFCLPHPLPHMHTLTHELVDPQRDSHSGRQCTCAVCRLHAGSSAGDEMGGGVGLLTSRELYYPAHALSLLCMIMWGVQEWQSLNQDNTQLYTPHANIHKHGLTITLHVSSHTFLLLNELKFTPFLVITQLYKVMRFLSLWRKNEYKRTIFNPRSTDEKLSPEQRRRFRVCNS